MRPIVLGICAAFFFAFTFLPFWFLLSLCGFCITGVPSREQTIQSILVAIFSGVIATGLFFQATDMVRGDMQKLAAVEATQSMEVLFAAVGEVMLLASPLPSVLAWCGMFMIMFGMILHSYVTHKIEVTGKQEVSA